MYSATREVLSDHIHKYTVTRDGSPIAYAEVLNLWQRDEGYRSFFLSLLSDSPFTAYRWETPPITVDTANRTFEFVLLNSPYLARTPDSQTFAYYFARDPCGDGIVAFENLRKDAMLVVPSPRVQETAYPHLAAFNQLAPDRQKHALWRIVGQQMHHRLRDRPLWLSTAGGGVAWLHVRLDAYPKYYAYAPYQTVTR